jgi:hypothetical protein
VEIIKLLKPAKSDIECDTVYELPTDAEELIEGQFWVFSQLVSEITLDFVFLSFHHSDIDGENIRVQVLMHGSGPLGALNECRHTWWGQGKDSENGYIFYPNATHIRALLSWLENKGFDLV